MIEIKNLSYSAGGKEILKNLNLKFERGKITIITGSNGSGKSTLIKLLMGIIQPTEGTIYYRGKDITSLSVTERANLGLTIALQQPVSFKGITVKKLLEIAGGEKMNIAEACNHLSRVGLCAKNYLEREFNNSLSGGEMKRIELALALSKGGEVFLFDEPEAGIDLWSFDSLVNIFKTLKDKTIIIVSHQKKILDIADNIALFDDCGAAKMGSRKEMQNALSKTPICKALGGKQ